MTTNRIGALQVVRYTPLGTRLHVIPDSGLVFASTPAGGTLQLTISEELYQELPDEIEVAVEEWQGDAAFGLPGWVELRDARFSLTSQNVDKADEAGMVKITGQALVPWMGEGAFLAGVAPYAMTGLVVIGAKILTGVSTSGSTFTKSNHNLSNGDRVRVEEAGKMNKAAVKQGGVYYVKVLSSGTFQLTSTLGAAVIKSVGSSSGDVKLERLRDQILAPGHQFRNGDRVSVSYADGSGLNDGSSYFIVRDGGDAFGLSNEAGGPAIELNSNTLNVFRDLDAERVFKGTDATPGYIIGKAFTEAQVRNGWGAGLTRDFSGTADSAGNPWLDMLEDEPGVPIGFRPGTSLTSLVAFMVDQSVAEFATEGRMLRLWNYGLGVDRSLGNTPVTLGRHATSIPVKKDLNSMASHIRVRGEGNVQVDVSQAPGAFGPLEMYVSAGGVTTAKLAKAIGNQKLKTTKDPQRQYAVIENAAEARFLAGRDYQRGEYVLALVSRKSPTPGRFRVAEIQWTKDSDGNVQVATILGDRITTSPLARLAALARKQSGGISVGGNGSPVATQDTRQPAAPVLNAPESVGGFSDTGAPVATVVATWAGVTTDIDGLGIYVDQYELWIREDGQLKGTLRSRTGGLLAEAGPYPSGRTLLVSVRARSSTGVWGPYSEEVEVVTATPIEPPLPPSQPTVSSSAGVATLTWNGLLVDPDTGTVDPELGFDHVYFERAADVAGAPGVFVPIGGYLGIASTYTDAEVTVGSSYWWRARAVSTVGVASQPSTAVQHTVAGVGESDLDPSLFLVVTSANGKNKTTFATTDPDPDPAGRNAGDLWWKRLGTVALGLWVWDGDTWESQVLADAVLGALDVAKLVAGAATIDTAVINKLVTELLTAGRIQSQMINVGAKLPSGTASGERVPAPLTDLAFWSQYTSGAQVFTTWGGDTIGNRGVVAGTGGHVLTPTGTLDARFYLMQRARVPESGKLHTRLASSGGNARLWLVWFTAAGVATEVQLTNNAEYVFPATAVEYTVREQLTANLPAETVAFATVFEAIGSGAGQQRTTVTPSGLTSVSDDGSGVVAIGTSTNDFISVGKDSGTGYEVKASINSDGDGVLRSLAIDGELSARGVPMFGASLNPVLRNEAEDVVPLMQRFAIGGTRMGFYDAPAFTTSVAFRSIAYAAFQLTAGRQYRFSIHSGFKVTNTGTSAGDLEVLVSNSPIPVTATVGGNIVKLNSTLLRGGEYTFQPFDITGRAMRTHPTLYTDLTLSPGTNYILLRTRNPNLVGLQFEEMASRGTLLIEDVGPEFEELQEITSSLTSGTPVAPTTLTTKDFTAVWSRSWEGSTIVTDSHDYGYENRIYQGLWASSFAAQFGFNALGLAGKTIYACQLQLTNRQAYRATESFPTYLGTHTLSSLPASRPATRDNPFSVQFRRGQQLWVDVPSTLWPSIAGGTIRGFTLGVDSALTEERAGFDGAGTQYPPKLRITYK